MLEKFKSGLHHLRRKAMGDGARHARQPNIQDKLPDVIENPSVKPQFERMVDWLPYAAYIEEHGLFVLESRHGNTQQLDALGFTVELTLLSAVNDEIAATFTALLQEAPNEACLQFQVFASPDIEPFLNQFTSLREGELFEAMAHSRAAFYRQAAKSSPFKSQPFLLRRFRFVLSCTVAVSDLEDLNAVDRIAQWRDRIVAAMKNANLLIGVWSPQNLIDWNNELLNAQQMWSAREQINYDDTKLLRTQMRDPQTISRLADSGDRLIFSQHGYPVTAVSTMSVRSYPEEFTFGAVTQLLGDLQTNSRQYTCPFLITVNVRKPDFERKKNKVNISAAEANRKARTPLAVIDPSVKDRAADWDTLQKAYKEGTGGVEMLHQILLFCKPEEVNQAQDAVRSVWRARGFALANDAYMGMQALFSSLPMGLTPAMANDIKKADRFSTKTTTNVIATAPIVADWLGYGDPVLPLVTRRGSVGCVDLFSNDEGNYNACVVGTSGSGKSVFCNELVASYRGVGGRAWVIDVGGSYRKLCGILSGQYIQFSPNNDICLNPFPWIQDLDLEMEMVHPLLGQMAAGIVGNGISSLQYAAIGQAIRLVWAEHQQQTTVTLIRNLLETGKLNPDAPYDKEIADLATMLDKYCEGGAYGKYFSGQPNINFESDFVVLELEELKGKKDLQSIVLLIMMYRITNEMYLGRRDRKKIVLIDEAWELLNGGAAAAEFIEAGYRRARKYGGAFMTATQGMDDYFKNPAATAAFDNADWMFVMRTKDASIASMRKAERLAMTPYMEKTLKSLRKIDGEYSEVFVICPKGNSVFRCMVDPYSILVYSSKGADFEAVERGIKSGLTVTEAITQVLQARQQTLLQSH
jgi:conjugal transfer ATP-binding protein TraC